jgi:D-alanyl-lipoteichoic acid acyltransferase DltB (MBOAT superfamily)
VALIVALFVWNKRAGGGLNVLASQSGVLFLGVSYLVLKMAGAIIDGTRGTLGPARARDLLAWLVFLPTYPSGPIEKLRALPRPVAGLGPATHPRRPRARALRPRQVAGVRAAARRLDRPDPRRPASASPLVLLLALYALLLRFYFDLAGYSDIAIGLAALYGYDIAENFDRPFAARNLAQFWQRWHITLTGWLRTYVFTLVTRPLLRRMAGRDDRLAIVAGILITLVLVGTWHGLHWNFVLYGFLHGVGVVWVSVYARDCGRWLLPAGTVRWWRQSRTGYLLSVALTFNTCALLGVFAVHDIGSAVRYLLALIGQ